MLLLPLPLSEESRAGRPEEMNQHASFPCEELLPCPTSILEAAPAALFSWEAQRNCALDMKGKGVKVEMREREGWKMPLESSDGMHEPCVREETACGAGSSG